MLTGVSRCTLLGMHLISSVNFGVMPPLIFFVSHQQCWVVTQWNSVSSRIGIAPVSGALNLLSYPIEMTDCCKSWRTIPIKWKSEFKTMRWGLIALLVSETTASCCPWTEKGRASWSTGERETEGDAVLLKHHAGIPYMFRFKCNHVQWLTSFSSFESHTCEWQHRTNPGCPHNWNNLLAILLQCPAWSFIYTLWWEYMQGEAQREAW